MPKEILGLPTIQVGVKSVENCKWIECYCNVPTILKIGNGHARKAVGITKMWLKKMAKNEKQNTTSVYL